MGASWSVKVRARGIPRPSLQWYRGEELVTSSERLELRTETDCTEIAISGLVREDSAPYRLVATNDVRTVSEEFTLRVLGEYALTAVQELGVVGSRVGESPEDWEILRGDILRTGKA